MAHITCPAFGCKRTENGFILCKNVVIERSSARKLAGKDYFQLDTSLPKLMSVLIFFRAISEEKCSLLESQHVSFYSECGTGCAAITDGRLLWSPVNWGLRLVMLDALNRLCCLLVCNVLRPRLHLHLLYSTYFYSINSTRVLLLCSVLKKY